MFEVLAMTLERHSPLPRGDKPLQRHTELRTYAELSRSLPLLGGGNLARTTELRRGGPIKAKPYVQSDAEEDARRIVMEERSGGLCEVCGLVEAAEYQHRKAKAHCAAQERWAPSNGLAVCGHGNLIGCHGQIHQQPDWAKERGYTVHPAEDPLLVPVWIAMAAQYLLDNEGGAVEVDPPEQPTEGTAA